MNEDILARQDGCEEGEPNKHEEKLEWKLLHQARTILVTGKVDRKLMERVTARLLYLDHEDAKAPITVYVNSPGGDADSGFAIYDMMKFVKAPVRTVTAGLCASAGVSIYLGGRKGKRFSLPNSRFLIHQPSAGTQGQASDIEITAKEIIKIRDRYNRIVAEETGVDVEKIAKDANRDFWLSAGEAMEYGLVDKVIRSMEEIK